MKQIMSRVLVLSIVFLTAALVRADDPVASGKSSSDNPLEPLAFLTTGEWEEKMPTQPDDRQVSILAHFTWVSNHKAIRISNVYVSNGKTVPYIDGLYAWNPQKKTIVFTYVDLQGNYYEGTVKPQTNGLLHEFVLIDAKGESTQYSARQTWDGTNAWINEISTTKDGKSVPEVTVRYEKK